MKDTKVDEVTADVSSLRREFGGLKDKFKLLEASVNSKIDGLNSNFETFEKNIELKISQAINVNMRWSIGMIALIVTVLKLADMYAK